MADQTYSGADLSSDPAAARDPRPPQFATNKDFKLDPMTMRPQEPPPAALPGKEVVDPAVLKALEAQDATNSAVGGSKENAPSGWSALNAIKSARDYATKAAQLAISYAPQNPLGRFGTLQGIASIADWWQGKEGNPKTQFLRQIDDKVSGELARAIVPQTAGDIPRTAAMAIPGPGWLAAGARVGMSAAGAATDYMTGEDPIMGTLATLVHGGGEVIGGLARRMMVGRAIAKAGADDEKNVIGALTGPNSLLNGLNFKSAADLQQFGQGGGEFGKLRDVYMNGIDQIKNVFKQGQAGLAGAPEIKNASLNLLLGLPSNANISHSLTDAMGAVRRLGQAAFTGSSQEINVMGQSIPRGQAKGLYHELQDAIVNRMNQIRPDLGQYYKNLRAEYDYGLDVAHLFSDLNVFTRAKDKVSFNMNPMAGGGTPLQQAALRMLGDFQNGSAEKITAASKLLQEIYRHGTIGGGDIAQKDLLSQAYLRLHKGAIGVGEGTGLGGKPGFVGKPEMPSTRASEIAPAAAGRGLTSLAPRQETAQ